MGESFLMDIFPWPKYPFLSLPVRTPLFQAPPFLERKIAETLDPLPV